MKVGPNAERREWGWVHLTLDVRQAEVEMPANRNVYTQKQKRAILDQTAGMTDADAAKKVRLINGFEKLKAQQIKRWREAAAQEERTGKRAKRARSLWGCHKVAAERATDGVLAEVMECET